MSNPFDLPDTDLLAEEAAEHRANSIICLVNIGPILAEKWTAARAEFMKTYKAPASFALDTDNELIKSDPQRMELRAVAAADAHADKFGIAPGVLPKGWIYRLGPTEDLKHIRSAREPFGKMTRPTIEVRPVEVLAAQKRRRPWVLKHEREAKMFLREYGAANTGRMDHQDRGLREWTPELHQTVILPYLRARVAAQKQGARGAAA